MSSFVGWAKVVGKGAERRAYAVFTLLLHRVGFAALSPPYGYFALTLAMTIKPAPAVTF